MATVYFGGRPPPARFELGLSNGARQAVTGWQVTGGVRSTSAVFVFPDGGSFEWAALFADGVEVPGTREDMAGQVPPGGDLVWTFGLTTDG